MADHGSRLVARALARSWRRHRLRAWATAAGAVIGVALATFVAFMTISVTEAQKGATGTDAFESDLVIAASSGTGLSPAKATELQALARPSISGPIIHVSTRLIADRDEPLILLGVTPESMALVPEESSRVLQDAARPEEGTSALILSESWAGDRGIERGDIVQLQSPTGTTKWTVSALVPGSLPNGGAVGFSSLTEVSDAFDRHEHVDEIYIRVAADEDRDALARRLEEAVDGAATVGPASAVIAPDLGAYLSIRMMLVVAGAVGLGVAGIVLFTCWRLLLADERPNLARFRLTGASRKHLVVGSGMLLLTATVVLAVPGILLGLLLGRLSGDITNTLAGLSGLAASSDSGPVLLPALIGMLGGLAMSAAAWLFALRSLSAIPIIEAIAPSTAVARRRVAPIPLLAAAVAATVAAAVAAQVLSPDAAPVALVFVGIAALFAARAIPVLVGNTVARSRRLVLLITGRELALQARRSTGMVLVFAIAAMMAICMAGIAATLERGISRGVRSWATADIFVSPSAPGTSFRDDKFTPEAISRLERLPGVRSASGFSSQKFTYAGSLVDLYAWDPDSARKNIQFDVRDGPTGGEFWDRLAADEVAVTSNFAYLHRLGVGDSVTLPTRTDSRSVRIAAVVDDYTSDAGVIYASRRMFESLTGDARIYNIGIVLADGASLEEVRQSIRGALPEYPLLTVWDKEEMHGKLIGTFTSLLSVFSIMAIVGFVLAALVAVATTAASLEARRASLAVTRLGGASVRFIRAQLGLESMLIGAVAWLLAVPLGFVVVHVGLQAVGAQTGLFPPAVLPVRETVITLPLTVLAAALSVWVPSRRLGTPATIEAIRHE